MGRGAKAACAKLGSGVGIADCSQGGTAGTLDRCGRVPDPFIVLISFPQVPTPWGWGWGLGSGGPGNPDAENAIKGNLSLVYLILTTDLATEQAALTSSYF